MLAIVSIALMGSKGFGYSENIPNDVVRFTNVIPYKYELKNGSYMVSANVSKECLGDNSVITFKGERLLIKSHNNDNFLLQLPCKRGC